MRGAELVVGNVVLPDRGPGYWACMLRSFLCGILVAALLAPQAGAWGRDGHELIAMIAEKHLTARARAEVARLLEQGETLASIATWADAVRPDRKETNTWHYINLPVTVQQGDWKKWCPDTGCVAGIIPEMQRRLRSSTASRQEKAEALKFLVHFVGDLHQPLHAGDRGDRGGNDVAVVFLDRPSNLHSIWDTSLLMWMLEKDPGLRNRLSAGVGYWQRRSMSAGGIDTWVWESHDLSRDVAYANLPDPGSAKTPIQLGAGYAQKAAPAIRLQIQRAGVRLARLLNETFSS